MNKKQNTPDPDNPFAALDKSQFVKERNPQHGGSRNYDRLADLKRAGKMQKRTADTDPDADAAYFNQLMGMGGVDKLAGSAKINPSDLKRKPEPAQPAQEINGVPPEWREEYFAEPEPAKPAELPPAPKEDKAASQAKEAPLGNLADKLSGIKLKAAPEPEPEDKGHDRAQEDQLLKEYLASAARQPGKQPGNPAKRAATNPAPGTMPSPAVQAEPEEDDFSLAMREVAPLSGKGREVIPEPVPPSPKISPANLMQDFMDGKIEFSLEFTEEFIEGHVLGLDPAIMGKLRAGSFSYEAHLDLHGLNSPQAFESLVGFIRQSYLTGKRTVLVIPGRGKNSPDGTGILRDKLQEWLTQDPFKRVVLAFATALPKHGGPGAVYVLLRKLKKSSGKIRWDIVPSDPDLFV